MPHLTEVPLNCFSLEIANLKKKHYLLNLHIKNIHLETNALDMYIICLVE